MQQLLLRLC